MDAINDCVNSVLNDLPKLPNHLEDEIQNLNLRIDKQLEFAKEDVQIRIESLRAKIDIIEASFENGWEESKEIIKESIFMGLKIDEHREEIKQIDNKTSEKKIEKIESMHALLNKFKVKMDSIRKVKPNIIFKENKGFYESLNENAIGKIRWSMDNSFNLRLPFGVFENIKPQIKKVDHSPSEIISLPGKRYLARHDNLYNNLLVLDSNFNDIKQFPSSYFLNCYAAISITCDSDNIYIAFKSSIIKYNYDFKKVSQKNYSGLNNLFIFEDTLYSCRDSTIASLTKDLEHVTTRQLEDCDTVFKLRIIKHCAFVACLSTDFEHVLRIYSFPNFKCTSEFAMRVSGMGIYKNYLCVYSDDNYLSCFNSDGDNFAPLRYPLKIVKDVLIADDNLIMCLNKPDGYVTAKISML